MADNFNGADLSWTVAGGSAVALNVIDVTYTEGEIPRVDATHAASSFKVYLAGIPEADTVSVTSYVSPGNPGDTGAFSGGNVLPGGTTYRIESVEESGSIDNAINFTSTFVKIA